MALIGTGNNTQAQGLSGLYNQGAVAVGTTTTTNNWGNWGNTTTGISGGLNVGGHNNIAIGYSSLVNGQQDMIDFFELVLVALGYDVDYADFCKMSKAEKKSLLRDIKIKRLIS